MLLALQVVIQHVLLSLLFLFWMTGGRYVRVMNMQTRLEALVFYAAMAGVFGFTLICGAWHIAGYWLRPVFAVLFIFASVDFFARLKNAPDDKPQVGAYLKTAFYAVLALVFGGIAVFGAAGRIAPEEHIELAFPLSDGIYVIGQGGATPAVNYHRSHKTQAYALDILKIDRLGFRAKGLMPDVPSRYEIFGALVTSPCDGRVVWRRDGLPDSAGAQRERTQPAGNAVAIDCGGATVLMAHFMKDSLMVEEGQAVRTGQPVARVGNSGNTTEPHLHIHAEKGAFAGEASTNPGLAIRFDGRWLVRGDLVFGARRS